MRGSIGTVKAVSFSVLVLLAITFLLFILPTSLSQPTLPTITMGETWEQSCSQDKCSLTAYSYQKHYQEAGEWLTISENFSPCEEGLCVTDNLYQVSLSSGEVTLTRESDSLSFQLLTIQSGETTLTPSFSSSSLTNNQIAYTDSMPGIDIQYTYLPRMFKEEITVRSQDTFSSLTQDPVLTYSFSTTGGFHIQEPWICDQIGECVTLSSSQGEGTYSFSLPLDWLLNETRVYPVTIDPTVILDDSDVINASTIDRTFTPVAYARRFLTILKVGRYSKKTAGFPSMTTQRIYRSNLEFDISQIPDNADITSVILQMNVSQLNDCNNSHNNITFHDMELQAISYPNANGVCQGNCLFNSDMGNHTTSAFGETNITGIRAWNFTLDASDDMESRLAGDWWGIGMNSSNETACKILSPGDTFKELRFLSPTTATAAARPRLYITYTFADESAGRDAIEEGINSSIPNNPIQTDQQIYLLNQDDDQFLGTFDKSTQKDNQTWAFNYVTEGEDFTNISSLFQILNIWENESLKTDEITSQVETFINQTKE